MLEQMKETCPHCGECDALITFNQRHFKSRRICVPCADFILEEQDSYDEDEAVEAYMEWSQ